MTNHEWKKTDLYLHARDKATAGALYLPDVGPDSGDSRRWLREIKEGSRLMARGVDGDEASTGRLMVVQYGTHRDRTVDVSVKDCEAMGGNQRTLELREPRWRDYWRPFTHLEALAVISVAVAAVTAAVAGAWKNPGFSWAAMGFAVLGALLTALSKLRTLRPGG
jgi:hypothetical protein